MDERRYRRRELDLGASAAGIVIAFFVSSFGVITFTRDWDRQAQIAAWVGAIVAVATLFFVFVWSPLVMLEVRPTAVVVRRRRKLHSFGFDLVRSVLKEPAPQRKLEPFGRRTPPPNHWRLVPWAMSGARIIFRADVRRQRKHRLPDEHYVWIGFASSGTFVAAAQDALVAFQRSQESG